MDTATLNKIPTFLQIWENANKTQEALGQPPLAYSPLLKKLFYINGYLPINNCVDVTNFDDENDNDNLPQESLLSITQFKEYIKTLTNQGKNKGKTTSTGNPDIIPTINRHRPDIDQTIAQQLTDSAKIAFEHGSNTNKSIIEQVFEQLNTEDKQKVIHKETTALHNRVIELIDNLKKQSDPKNLTYKKILAAEPVAALAKINNNTEELQAIENALLKIKKSMEKTQKAQEYKPERNIPLPDYIKLHEKAIEVLFSRRFIKSLKRDNYKKPEDFKTLTCMPMCVVNQFRKLGIRNPEMVEKAQRDKTIIEDKEFYTEYTLFSVYKAKYEYDEYLNKRFMRRLKITGCVLAIIVVLFIVLKLTKSNNNIVAQQQQDTTTSKVSAIVTDEFDETVSVDKLIQKFERENNYKFMDYSVKVIKQTVIQQNLKTEKEILKIIEKRKNKLTNK